MVRSSSVQRWCTLLFLQDDTYSSGIECYVGQFSRLTILQEGLQLCVYGGTYKVDNGMQEWFRVEGERL